MHGVGLLSWWLGVVCVVCVACGSASASRLANPAPGDWRRPSALSSRLGAHDLALLSVGVDPCVEAEAAASGIVGAGFEIHTRVEGASFVAFDARHADGRTVVRVVTSRGIAVALDTSREEGERSVALLDDPSLPRDLDDDGAEEVVVSQRLSSPTHACLAVLRVGADGNVHEVPTRGLEDGGCVLAVRDVGADARPELIATRTQAGLPLAVAPTVTTVLAPRDGGYVLVRSSVYRELFADERARRGPELEAAHRRLDVPTAHTLAVELAAIAREEGLSVNAQLSAFDAALRGLVLSEADAEAIAWVRQLIGRGWIAPPESTAPAPDDAPEPSGE